MAGKFEIRKSGDQWTFVLKAGNVEVIATSEPVHDQSRRQERHRVGEEERS